MAREIQMAPSPGRPFDGAGVRRISRLDLAKMVKIGTWNVRSLMEMGKLKNVTIEMEKMDIGILGVCETRWHGAGKFESDGYTVHYSGVPKGKHRSGMAVIIRKDIAEAIKQVTPVTDRIILIQFDAKPVPVSVIQVYAPTSDSSDEDIEDFYDNHEKTLRATKKNEAKIVIGDFNAKVGNLAGNVTGRYGLGNRNERGERLIQFCQTNKLIVGNTYFKLPKCRLYTWKAPGDNLNNVIRNQIDYFLINRRYRNALKSVKTYPGADANTDHTLLLAKLKIKLKKVEKVKPKRFRLELLKNKEISRKVQKTLNKNLREKSNQIDGTVDSGWAAFKEAALQTAEELLRQNGDRRTQKEWITDEIIALFEKRRD
ncbi:craniofacial development protein 2-like [Planococcus citri]|uniref:craniofacial development protein 2-like n=1 Tax=Planococcus citri TaxID=170843 RepID=UPI0031F8AD40